MPPRRSRSKKRVARSRAAPMREATAAPEQLTPPEPIRTSPQRSRREWLLLAVILVVTFFAFINALKGEFVYDDQFQVLKNPTIKTLANIPKMFVQSVWQFADQSSRQSIGPYYRPLFNIVLNINYQLFGLKVFGWHLVSILLHLIVTLFVYLLGRRWQLSPWEAGASALFFGLHPIHSESVAWISALPDPLAAAFTLASLLFYERQYHESRGRWYLLTLSLLFAMLAMLSKEVAVAIPVFVFVRNCLDRTPAESFDTTSSRALARTVPFAMVAVVYLVMRYQVLGFLSKTDPNAASVPTANVFLTIPSILLSYARMFFVPFPLAFMYDHTYVSSARDPRFWASALSAIAVLTLVIWLARSSPRTWRPLVWSVLFLVPALNLKTFNQQESLLHDRYLYLPSIGLCMLLALLLTWTSARFGTRTRWVFWTSAILIGASFLVLTVYQNRSWRNPIVLGNHGADVAPRNALLRYYLGCIYQDQGGQDSAAEQEYLRAVEYNPSYTEARINLAVLLSRQGRYEEALDQLQSAQRLAPDQTVMLYALGYIYLQTNRHREAIEPFSRLARLEPRHQFVYTNLGLCYEAVGQREQAKANFQKAIEVAPDESWTDVARAHLETLRD